MARVPVRLISQGKGRNAQSWGQHDIEIGAQRSTQAIGVVSAIVYTAVITFVILKVTEALVGNRVDDEDEMQGLDLISHDERGYDL